MNSIKHPIVATAKAAGVAAALILGLTLSAGGAAADARSAGADTTPVTNQSELSCEKDQAAAEATLDAAAQDLKSSFKANHRTIEQLREKAGERNQAAQDLLKQADSQLKEIRTTAKTALDAAGQSAEACIALDTVAINATVDQAIADMDAVVADVTATVAALPATDVLPAADVKADVEDEDEASTTSDADHETKSAEKSGEKSTVNATAASKGHSKD